MRGGKPVPGVDMLEDTKVRRGMLYLKISNDRAKKLGKTGIIRKCPLLVAALLAGMAFCEPAPADVNQKAAVAFMEPSGTEAKFLSDGHFGLSYELHFHGLGLPDELSLAAGLDWFGMMSETSQLKQYLPLRVEQTTTQQYLRLLFGVRVQSPDRVLFRPYLGAHVAIVYYEVQVDLTIPNDADPDSPLEQDLGSDSEFALGYAATAGMDIRVGNGKFIDVGVKRLMSFGEPHQLGYDAVEVKPRYNVYYLGFRWLLTD